MRDAGTGPWWRASRDLFRPVTAGDVMELPDLVRRDFTATAPGCKLVGGHHPHPTWQGWLFLATVLDCFSKKVVGYAMADHMRTSLVTEALQMAAKNVGFTKGETIFHSDRGTQYLSCNLRPSLRFGHFAGPLRRIWPLLRQCLGRNLSTAP